MLKLLSKYRPIFILLLFLVFITLIILLNKVTVGRLTINSVYPTPDTSDIGYLEPVKITIKEKSVFLDLLSISVEPELKLIKKIENNTLVFDHDEPLSSSTKYKISVFQKNFKEPIYLWQFSTLPKQTDVGFLNKINELKGEYYPLLDYMPIKTDQYEIQYQDRLSLKIIIFSDNAEMTKKQALEFIKNKGVDPGTHQIEWVEI